MAKKQSHERALKNQTIGVEKQWAGDPFMKILVFAIPLVALLMIVYHIGSTWFPVFGPILHQNVHIAFAFVLLFLVAVKKSNSRLGLLYLTGLAAGLIVTIYIHVNVERLDMYAGFPEPMDIAIGLILVALVVFLTLKIWGAVFPILLGISVLYALFGHLIPGALGHAYMNPKLVLSNLGIGLTGTYGMVLNASANLIFLFIIFGSVFESVGIDKFFIEVGNFLGSRMRGGAAQTAIFSSSFVGMCTGAAAANVALTGSYTIPLMKSAGFRPEHAGAIEAVASTGGQLTPPIMGVAIFLMASFLGVNYGELMLNALVPAIVYYTVIVIAVIMIASRDNIPMLKHSVKKSMLVLSGPLFVFPMGLVTYLLIRRYTPAYAAVMGLMLLLFISVLRKETRPSIKDLVAGFSKGAIMASGIAVACACIGMFMVMLTSTGAGPKLAGIIQVLAGGNLLVALILTMVLSILLGCAMPTPVAYVITALVVSPALVEMGLNMMTAHFYVYYFAILSAVTPPVAGATMVGSQIAGTSYIKTGWESFKLVTPFFLVPYFLAKNPIIFLKNQAIFGSVTGIFSLIIAVLSLTVFCQGYCFKKVNGIERILFLVVAITGTAYGHFGSPHLLILTFFMALMGLIFMYFKKKMVIQR